jgi:hypothetical protein
MSNLGFHIKMPGVTISLQETTAIGVHLMTQTCETM